MSAADNLSIYPPEKRNSEKTYSDDIAQITENWRKDSDEREQRFRPQFEKLIAVYASESENPELTIASWKRAPVDIAEDMEKGPVAWFFALADKIKLGNEWEKRTGEHLPVIHFYEITAKTLIYQVIELIEKLEAGRKIDNAESILKEMKANEPLILQTGHEIGFDGLLTTRLFERIDKVLDKISEPLPQLQKKYSSFTLEKRVAERNGKEWEGDGKKKLDETNATIKKWYDECNGKMTYNRQATSFVKNVEHLVNKVGMGTHEILEMVEAATGHRFSREKWDAAAKRKSRMR
jgi:hypothetical protein